MKAKIIYRNGWLLSVPKYGLFLMLLMEHLMKYRAGANKLHKVKQGGEDTFWIYLNVTKRELIEIESYLNNNAGE